MNIDKYITIKGFDEADVKPMDEDEYYENRTDNPQKYETFYFIDFYLR